MLTVNRRISKTEIIKKTEYGKLSSYNDFQLIFTQDLFEITGRRKSFYEPTGNIRYAFLVNGNLLFLISGHHWEKIKNLNSYARKIMKSCIKDYKIKIRIQEKGV